MAEQLALSTPEVVPQITNAQYRVAFLGLYPFPTSQAAIVVHLLGQNGERLEVRTDDAAEALALLQQLNTANLSTNSLQKRVLNWCASKRAALTGTVIGTPD